MDDREFRESVAKISKINHCQGLPDTNNALEGTFSDLKSKVRVHSGISKENRKKLLDEYIKRHY